jgi:uncharacterized membrane protein YgcG
LKFWGELIEKRKMKRIFLASPVLLLSAGMLLVQGTPSRAATKIMPGTIIPVELAKTLDAKKVKAGDKIEAKIVVDLLSDGQVIIPKGAKITGHISDAKARSKDSKDSMIGIVFDQLSTKDGGDLAIQAAIQAIGPPVESGPSSSSVAGGPIGSSGSSMPGGGAGQSSGGSGHSLNPSSQGVVGLRGLSLSTSGPVSVVSSSNENVHLDSGTQILLRIQ